MTTKPLMTCLFLSLPLWLASCVAPTSHVVVGSLRAPVDPSQVRVYVEAPVQYEVIAMVETSSEYAWAFSDQGKMDEVLLRLKEHAASLGANGLLLKDIGSMKSGGTVLTDTSDENVSLGFLNSHTEKTASALAIHVPQDGPQTGRVSALN
jgi:hypothetical protein